MQSHLPDDVLISILSKNSFPRVVQLYRTNQRYQQLLENKDVLRQLTDIYRQEIVQDDTLGDKKAIVWNLYPQSFAEYTELIRKERYDTLECDSYHDALPCIISAVQRDDYSIFAQLVERKWKSLTYPEKEKCLTEIMKLDREKFFQNLFQRGIKADSHLVEMAIDYNAPKILALSLQNVSMEKDKLLSWIKLALKSLSEEALLVLLQSINNVDEGLAEKIISLLEEWPLNNRKSMAMAKALLEFIVPTVAQGSSTMLNKFLEIALVNRTLASVLYNQALLDRVPDVSLEENTVTDLLPVLIHEGRYDILKEIVGDVFYGDAKSYGDRLAVAIEKEDWELFKLLQGIQFETDWSRLYASLDLQKSLPKANVNMLNALFDWSLDQPFVPGQTPIMFIVFLLVLQRVQDADDLMSLFSVSNREKAEILREYKRLVQYSNEH